MESAAIIEQGSGYVRGSYNNTIVSGCSINLNIPRVGTVISDATIEAVVGEILIAELRFGQYETSIEHDGQPGLCREVTRAMQQAASVSEFPYSVLDENEVPISVGSCSITGSNPNATLSKKFVIRRGETTITSGNQAFLELLFGTYESNSTAGSLLGYGTTSDGGAADSLCPLNTDYKLFREGFPIVGNGFTYQDLSIIGNNIYNLNDTPNYVVIRLANPEIESFKKLKSNNETIKGGSFIASFQTGTDAVYFDQTDSQTEILDIIGETVIHVNPAKRMNHLYIEIRKANGDLYGTARELILIFNIKLASKES